MQFSNINMSTSQSVVSGNPSMPDYYNTQLNLPQQPNTQFVGNPGVQPFTAMPVFSVPMINPSVGLNNLAPISENNVGNMTVSPLPTPPNPTQFQFPMMHTSMPVGYPAPFAPQAYFPPNMVPQFCFPGGENEVMSMATTPTLSPDATTPPLMSTVPAPAGYVASVTPMQIDDSGQSPGLQPVNTAEWKSDPTQTQNVQQVYAIPNLSKQARQLPDSQPGTYYLTPTGVMVEVSKAIELPTDVPVSSEATTVKRSPSRSVESEDTAAMVAVLQNQINELQNRLNGATIQSHGKVGVHFVNEQQHQQSNIQHSNQNFGAQMNSLQQQQQQNVSYQMPIPQQEAPAMPPQNNYMDQSANQKDCHRDHSRSMMNRSPPGFLEGYKIHRVQNAARENLNQHSNNYENQAQIYGSRNSDDVRMSNNGPQNRRNRTNDYNGRRNRNIINSQPVPMVNATRQNKRPRKETRKGGNKNTRRRTKRYGYRTKQDKIENVYSRVTEYFSELGVLVPEDHGVRGETVARVHIKKWLSLVKIEEAIAQVEADTRIKTVRVSAPVSMKNQYQKKGFLIYWETETVEGLNHLMAHFKSYDEKDEDGSWKMDEFQKISVALQNDQNKYPNAMETEQNASPSVETTVPKASLASLNACLTKPTISTLEAKVPFHTTAANSAEQKIPIKKPTILNLEKLAFGDEEDAFGEDAFGFSEKITPPCIEKFASNCSICSIGA